MPRSRRLRIGLILLTLLAAVGGVASYVRRQANFIVGTVTVGSNPIYTLTLDERRGRVFVVNRQDGALSVLDARTGTLLRTVTIAPNSVYAWLAPPTRAGRLFVSDYETGTITMLDAQTGAILRTVTDSGDRGLAVDERTNQVFVASASDVVVLDARSGVMRRHVPACSQPFAVALSTRTEHVFVRCNDSTIAMLDARTGRLLRVTPDQSGQSGFIVVDERTNCVFAGFGNTPTVDMLDARTGAYLRAIALDPTGPPTVDARTGRVYITLGDAGAFGPPPHKSEIAIIDGQTGAILRRIPVHLNPVSLAIDPGTGYLLVGSVGALQPGSDSPIGAGTVSVLDSRRGRILRTVQVGITPADIAIDVQTKRALVVNSFSDAYGRGELTTWRPPEGWWPPQLRRLKHWLTWLPVVAPTAPAPTTAGTVTTLDLTQL